MWTWLASLAFALLVSAIVVAADVAEIDAGWILLALWVLGTAMCVAVIIRRARAEECSPGVRLLFERQPPSQP